MSGVGAAEALKKVCWARDSISAGSVLAQPIKLNWMSVGAIRAGRSQRKDKALSCSCRMSH